MKTRIQIHSTSINVRWRTSLGSVTLRAKCIQPSSCFCTFYVLTLQSLGDFLIWVAQADPAHSVPRFLPLPTISCLVRNFPWLSSRWIPCSTLGWVQSWFGSERRTLFHITVLCKSQWDTPLDFESYRDLTSKNSQSTQEGDMHIKWPEYSVPGRLPNSCAEGMEYKFLTPVSVAPASGTV